MDVNVDFRTRFAARQAAKVAADLCGTETPEVVFEPLPRGVEGQTRGAKSGRIYLDPDLTPGKAMLTAAHETRHLHKMRIGSIDRFAASDLTREWAEDDARQFEPKAMRALADRHGDSLWFEGAVDECDELSDQLQRDAS